MRRPAGEVVADDANPGNPLIHESYRFHGSPQGLSGVGPLQPGLEYESPDPSALGALLCVESFVYTPWFRSGDERCGIAPDQPAFLHLLPGPTFSTPAFGTPAVVGLVFSWSALPEAVYRLTFAPEQPSADTPQIRIFTAARRASWPSLERLGVSLKGLAAYGASVTAIGPYTGIDDAASRQGFATNAREHTFSASSVELSVPVQPPMGNEEASCQYAEGTAIICGHNAFNLENPDELYVLSAINRKLRHYPELASEIGIHCVRDCPTARLFVKAYSAYKRSHGQFDANEPIEPAPPIPRPPGTPPPGVSP